eukprot:scaffold1954_cov268-Pinguiococcus_pyrenoidosus.AAC.89
MLSSLFFFNGPNGNSAESALKSRRQLDAEGRATPFSAAYSSRAHARMIGSRPRLAKKRPGKTKSDGQQETRAPGQWRDSAVSKLLSFCIAEDVANDTVQEIQRSGSAVDETVGACWPRRSQRVAARGASFHGFLSRTALMCCHPISKAIIPWQGETVRKRKKKKKKKTKKKGEAQKFDISDSRPPFRSGCPNTGHSRASGMVRGRGRTERRGRPDVDPAVGQDAEEQGPVTELRPDQGHLQCRPQRAGGLPLHPGERGPSPRAAADGLQLPATDHRGEGHPEGGGGQPKLATKCRGRQDLPVPAGLLPAEAGRSA